MPAVSLLTWCSRASLAAVGGSSAAAAREIFACLRRVTTLRRSAGFFAPPGLAGFRQRNRDCLLAALHLAAGTTLETSLFVFVHNLFDFALLGRAGHLHFLQNRLQRKRGERILGSIGFFVPCRTETPAMPSLLSRVVSFVRLFGTVLKNPRRVGFRCTDRPGQ